VTLSRRDFLAGVTAAGAQTALLGSRAFAWPGNGHGGGNGGGGNNGGGGATPAGTIYHHALEGVCAIKGDGSGRMVVLPGGFRLDPDTEYVGHSPSNRIYGPDTYFDRWFLTVARNPDRVYDWVYAPDGTVAKQNALYWDVVALKIAPDASYEIRQMTDLFKANQISTERYPEWGTDGTDLWFTFRGHNVTQSVVEENGEVSLYHPLEPGRNYLVYYSVQDMLDGVPPVADLSDPRIIELPTEGDDTIDFSMAPTQDAFVYHPGGFFHPTNMLMVYDLLAGAEYPLVQHENLSKPFRSRWSPAGDRILHGGRNSDPNPSGIFLSIPDPQLGMNATPIIENVYQGNTTVSYDDQRFSPDGQHVMFQVWEEKGMTDRIWHLGVARADGSERALLTNDSWLHTWVSDLYPGE
jgi:hypothetical protein